MDNPNQLSRGGAFAMGLLFMSAGGVPLLMMALGYMPAAQASADHSPAWVGVCAGLLFVVAGLTIIVDYGFGHMGPDGQFSADTPFAIQAIGFVLGAAIVVMMIAIFGWVAFGAGHRTFSTTISLPFMTRTQASNELTGRIAFGFATVVFALMFAACGYLGVRKLAQTYAAGQSRGSST